MDISLSLRSLTPAFLRARPPRRPPGHARQSTGVKVTMIHGVTLPVMPALIYASGINEVVPQTTRQRVFIKTNPQAGSAVYIYS